MKRYKKRHYSLKARLALNHWLRMNWNCDGAARLWHKHPNQHFLLIFMKG